MLRPTLIALTLSSLFALPAAAQVSPPSDPPPVSPDTMQKVEVKADANSYDPRRDDTASRIVVSTEEIKRYGDTSVLDVFKRLPGITVGGGGGRGAGEIRMRGLGSGYTQILINGERAPAGFDIDQLSPDVIERIEILRAASAEFSTQSIAGTINIVLKRVVRKAQRELRVGYGKSEDASNPSASLNMSDRLDGLSYSLGASVWRFNFDRPQPYEETQTDPEGRLTQLRRTEQNDSGSPQGFNLTPRLNWTLENGDTVSWQTMASYNRNDYHGDAATTTELGAPPMYDVRDMNSGGSFVMLRSDVNWVHNLEEGAKLDLKLGVNGTRNRGDWREFDYRLDELARDSTVLSATDERGLTSVGKYTTPWRKDHALAMGWDAGYTQREDARDESEVFPLFEREQVTNENYDATIKRLALYIQDEWNVSKQWSMYAGLRWEGLETTSEGNTFETSTNRASVFSPLAQTLYKIPDSRDQVRLALTRTFKAPSASNLIPRRFTTPNNSQTDPDFRGNPDLQPELATGIDAAYEHWWADKALLSASVSVRRIEDYTRQGLILEDGRWIQTPVNDGDALTRSLELEAKFPLSAVLADVPEIDLRASVSRNWSEVDAVPGPDNRLDQQVPLSATLGIDYKTRDGKLSTGASFAFKDGGPVRVNVEQSRYQSVRRDLDVYALWKFNPKYQLRLAASNLLRQDGVSDSRYTDEFGTLRRTSFSEGQTMARVTLESRF
ncbi:TonB-dependent receptor plug domain-containing protein [Massilia arenae]|uniref:Outer membrane beta-barrel protein n=1 Tax=Massilia arenae TaxID=2603288 RepID=A0A5C7FZS5_9BURK|nr:TonB-dependent receptor [Massilia arenae]TXF96146.1 outer membrane beta-barrel protein [Massilia arenae]